MTRGYMQTFNTRAGAPVLWRALVDPALLRLWQTAKAQVEPRESGRYLVDSPLFGRREATIEVFRPEQRLRLLFDPNPAWPPLAEGAIVEDFIVDARDDKRSLRLIGSGVPDSPDWAPVHKRLRAGWAIAFAKLQRALETGQIGGEGG